MDWRVGFFLGTLIIVAVLELGWPKRRLRINKIQRWTRNLSMIAVASLFTRLALPITTLGVAHYAQTHQLGLFHTDVFNQLGWSATAWIVICIILLDLLIYLQHVASHHIPLLWRIHKVHHIDQDIDVTTGLRFHPVEILLSTLYKCLMVLLLGIPVAAVLIFEVLLNVSAMFTHGNIALPRLLDKYLRWLIVVPDMHRVHHSTLPFETNKNFGFNLSCWDILFKTYQAQPKLGHTDMKIGLAEYQDAKKTGFLACLLLPFKAQHHPNNTLSTPEELK